MNLKIYEKTKYNNIYKHIKNGSYAVDLSLGYDIYGKRIRTTQTGLSLQEAKKIRDDEKNKIITKNRIVINQSFEETFNSYYNYCEHGLKLTYNTLKKKKSVFNNYIIPYFINQQIPNITKNNIINFHKYLNAKELNNRTKNDIHSLLNTFFNWCENEEIILKNPMHSVKNYKLEKKEMEFYDIDEWKIYCDNINKELHDPKTHFKALLTFTISNILYFGGLRISELRAIKIKNLNFKENYIDIQKSLVYEKDKGWVESNTKTISSFREVYMNETIMNYIKEFIEYYKKKFGIILEANDYLFLNPKTLKLYSEDLIRQHINYYINKSNLKHIRIHDFRHSHAALLLSNGEQLYDISKRLGHARIEITANKYGHLDKKAKIRVAKSLDKFM